MTLFVCHSLQPFWREKAKDQPPAVLQPDKGNGFLLPSLQLNKASAAAPNPEPRPAWPHCKEQGSGLMRKREQRSIRLCCLWERFLKDKGNHFINS